MRKNGGGVGSLILEAKQSASVVSSADSTSERGIINVKQLNPNQFTEKEGVNAVSTIVNRMSCTWRPTPNDDYGIDGEIEINVEGKPTGKIIKVQCKSGKSYLKNETQYKFEFVVKEDDLDYWLNTNTPIILVVHDDVKNIPYWLNVRKYVQRHPKVLTPPHKITFEKRYDVFSENCYLSLCEIVLSEKTIVEAMKNKVAETIHSNLLPVTQLPLTLHSAPTNHTRTSALEALKDTWKPPFIIKENMLWTFADLYKDDCPLKKLCKDGGVLTIKAQELWLDDNKKKWYIELLNISLHKKCLKLGLKYDSDHKRYYFPPNDDGTPREVEFQAFKRMGKRKVAYPYYSKINNEVQFWVHHAVKFKFISLGGEWFLQIESGYVFTRDGKIFVASNRVGSLSTRRKAKEWNIAVFNNLIFWRECLSNGYPNISMNLGDQRLEIGKHYEAGEAYFGIIKDRKEIVSIFSFDEPEIELEQQVDKNDTEDEF